MTTAAIVAGPSDAADRRFFGHPKGLGFILAGEAGYAFAYTGLQTMLTLYMTSVLLKPGHVEHVWGFGLYRAFLEGRGHAGTMTPLDLASHTYGLVLSTSYALPLLGGVLADRWLGQRRAVLWGLGVLTAAFVLLIREETFLVGLVAMIVGVGLEKTSMVGQIGRLYAAHDPRRTRAFGLFLITLNAGALVVPLVAGTLAERVGWTYGLTALAAGLALGTAGYGLGLRHMPPDRMQAGPVKGAPPLRLSRGDLRVVAALGALLVLNGLCIGLYNQAWNVLPVWTAAHVDRHILGWLTPVTWFATFDGVMTILGVALAVRLWAWQDARRTAPAEVPRLMTGLVMMLLGFAVLAATAWMARGGLAPLWPVLGFFVLVDFATPWLDTVVMAAVSRDAPASVNTTMIGVYYLAIGAGNYLTGWLGGFADHMSGPAFWLMHAGILAGALAALVMFGGVLRRALAAGTAAAA